MSGSGVGPARELATRSAVGLGVGVKVAPPARPTTTAVGVGAGGGAGGGPKRRKAPAATTVASASASIIAKTGANRENRERRGTRGGASGTGRGMRGEQMRAQAVGERGRRSLVRRGARDRAGRGEIGLELEVEARVRLHRWPR